RSVRITPLCPSSIPPPPVEEIVTAIAELLLAAAHADGEFCKREKHTVRRVTQQLLERDDVPSWLQSKLEAFDVEHFDLERTTAVLRKLPAPQKRYVLEAVRRVCDANNAFDLEEERFVSALVLALECAHDDHQDLLMGASPSLDGAGK